MQAEAAQAVEPAKGRKRLLLPLIATVVLAGAGFGSTFMDFWSPLALIAPGPEAAAKKEEEPADRAVAFVAVPPIELTLAGGSHSVLGLATVIETEAGAVEAITALLPRVLDGFNGFLSGVDPLAFDKRGVLDIIKYELTARAREALPDLPVTDLLITEFRLK
ncbi:flagellar basal body-associated FliL family protein [Paracoccus zhejiangensis]|uniref:Flagellar basal body protein FliL n=1 Tax=Paracoccus zhejiangensis TaxID=1077935 RepID=A0A2H5EYY1_9RHOB|nr:flagellar basal body protein FliL [Paracoccus zhejiangensis]AUH64506.1 flagellar basal body protein FliL [Paracoccus zhejiangensis]